MRISSVIWRNNIGFRVSTLYILLGVLSWKTTLLCVVKPRAADVAKHHISYLKPFTQKEKGIGLTLDNTTLYKKTRTSCNSTHSGRNLIYARPSCKVVHSEFSQEIVFSQVEISGKWYGAKI